MRLDRLHITLLLEVATPLSIGSGRRKAAPPGPSSDEQPQIIDVLRDHDGLPCIPATSLKGALRARLADEALAARFFGVVKDQKETGETGRLVLSAAHIEGQSSRPHNPAGKDTAIDAYCTDRPATAIDRDTGAVARNKLFSIRSVAPGTVFRCRLTLEDSYSGLHDLRLAEDVGDVGRTLAPLVRGLWLGKGSRTGAGLLTLADGGRSGKPIDATLRRFDPQRGYVVEAGDLTGQLRRAMTQAATAAPAPPRAALSFELVSEGPFYIADPAPRTTEEGTAVTQAVQDAQNHPVLWASSLLGVLRSRCAWIAEIDRLRSGGKPSFVPPDRRKDDPADDLDLRTVLGDARAVRSAKDVRSLSSCERLFGVAGFKGLLGVDRLELVKDAPGHPETFTNVAIDRLSGGAMHTALFTVEAFVGARWRVELSVRVEGRTDWVPDVLLGRDLALLSALKDDIQKRGLQLGHAASRGFGWLNLDKVHWQGTVE